MKKYKLSKFEKKLLDHAREGMLIKASGLSSGYFLRGGFQQLILDKKDVLVGLLDKAIDELLSSDKYLEHLTRSIRTVLIRSMIQQLSSPLDTIVKEKMKSKEFRSKVEQLLDEAVNAIENREATPIYQQPIIVEAPINTPEFPHDKGPTCLQVKDD